MSSDRVIEMTGDDVEEAIARGLAELGVGPGDVIVEVLEEPSRGLFGINARQARVRLQVIMTGAPVYEDSEEADPATFAEEAIDEVETAPEIGEDSPVPDGAPVTYDEGDSIDEEAEVGRVVLLELLEKMDILDGQVTIRRAAGETEEDENPWILDVSGRGNMKALIGKKGETLASLQYITRLITSRELQRRANIVVDVEGYKSRRMTKLHELAIRMADQAIREGRTVSLEPMPPYERRIVHLALREREDVVTKSVGEGEMRKVTIVPK
jgi:spoIIIJ-associated protein